MKRGAEKQLTKDDDDDIEEIQDPQGFQKADDPTLAKRQIRALPKRALGTSKPPALNGLPPALAPDADKADATPPPKFGGFTGFGAGTAPSNPFTFTPQPPPVFASLSSESDIAFKPISSFLPPSLAAPKTSLLDADTPPKPATSPPAEETDTVAFKYFKSLRGLNVSFLSAISAAVEKDPFFDVANLVESYKNLRTTIQSEFDGSSQSSPIHRSVPANFNPLFGKPPPEKPTSLFSMPKPSGPSAEVSSKIASIGESGTKVGGFTFAPFLPPTSSVPTQPQLPFGLAAKSSETPSTTPPELPKSAFTFGASKPLSTSSTPPTSGFSFVVPASVEPATSNLAPRSSSQENEGSSAVSSSRPTSTAPSNFFANVKSTSAFGTSDGASKPTSVFGGSIFGGGTTTDSNKQSLFTPPPPDDKDSAKVKPTFFGSTTTVSSTPTSIFGSSADKPASFFGSASPPKNNAFTFGKPGGSIGNPVGFGFGSSPSPSTGDTTAPGSSSSGFNFGAPSAKPSESLFSPPPTDKSTESTPQPDAEGNEESGEDDATKLLPSHTHDEEGEGEEDEETVHVIKCKLYRLFKSDDKTEWKDLGIGMFRLKKHKTTNIRRALMRNSSTGRILVNFRIYAGLKSSSAKTGVSFIGYENNTPTSFRIRVKTEEQAEELRQAMEREIAAVQMAE